MAKALGANWPEYPDAESVWNELADLAPNWYGVRYDRIEENGVQWPVTEIGGPDTPHLHAPAPARPPGKGKFFPVEYQRPIEEPDSEYPLVLSTGRTLYHYNSATMTMRESGITDKQVAAVLRDLGGGRLCARPRPGRPRAARLPTRSARGSCAHLGSRLPRSRLDGAPLRRAEGQLAHARRDRLADRDAGVQGERRAGRTRGVTGSLAPDGGRAAPRGPLREAVSVRAGVRVDAAAPARIGVARGRRRRHGSPDRRSGEVGA